MGIIFSARFNNISIITERSARRTDNIANYAENIQRVSLGPSRRHFHRRRRHRFRRETERAPPRRRRGSLAYTCGTLVFSRVLLLPRRAGEQERPRGRALCLAAAYGMTRKIRGIGRRGEVSRSSNDGARPPASFRRRGVPMTRPFYPIGNKNVPDEFS